VLTRGRSLALARLTNAGSPSRASTGDVLQPAQLVLAITPEVLTKAVTDPDPAVAKRAFDAMMQMKKIDISAIEAARRG
jgi:hypothetical protein